MKNAGDWLIIGIAATLVASYPPGWMPGWMALVLSAVGGATIGSATCLVILHEAVSEVPR